MKVVHGESVNRVLGISVGGGLEEKGLRRQEDLCASEFMDSFIGWDCAICVS